MRILTLMLFNVFANICNIFYLTFISEQYKGLIWI